MNKKVTLPIIVSILLTMTLTACGKASTTGADASSTTTTGNTLTGAMLLVAGTLKLEGTDQAVQADQAAKLLPLWQAYQMLSSSDTAAKAEIDGLVSQILSTMTTEQMQAITNMKLTYDDVASLGQSFGGPGMQGTPSASGTAFPGAGSFPSGGNMPGGPGGNIPSGGPPSGGGFAQSGGGMPGGGSDITGITGQGGTTAQTTPQASRGSQQGTGVNPMLLNALINLLQGKTQTSK